MTSDLPDGPARRWSLLDGPAEYVAPVNATEEALQTIFQDLLHTSPISTNSNFFQLGGSSLVAMQLMARARAALGVQSLSVTHLFQGGTIAELAVSVGRLKAEEGIPTGPGSVLMQLAKAPYHLERLPLSYQQEQMLMLFHIEANKGAYNSSFAMQLGRATKLSLLRQAWEALAARHASLRTYFPSHPDGTSSAVVIDAAAYNLDYTGVQGHGPLDSS
jgi:iturin family lipopeptide synthetase A